LTVPKFSNLLLDSVDTLNLGSRYKPAIGDPTDTSNFDPNFTRKKFLESEALPTTELLQDTSASNQFDDFTYVGESQLGAENDGLDD
jgi:hypothetical protein